jgi:hypothetical protein
LGGDTPEQRTQPLHHIQSLPHRCLDHTGKRRERLRSPSRLRALRHLALDHRESKPTLGAIVRRLDPRIFQEPQQIAVGMVLAELIQQPLVVRIGFDRRLM